MKKQKVILIVLIASFLLLSVAFIPQFLKAKPAKISNVVNNQPIYNELNDQEKNTSQQILRWLDTQKDEKGIYNSVRVCDVKNKCSTTGPSHRTGFAVIWARYQYYLRTGDTSQLEAVKSDINNYQNVFDGGIIQNNHYDCFFLYDLYKSSDFDDGAKEKLNRLCFDTEYEIEDNPYSFEMTPNSPEYLKDSISQQQVDDLKNSIDEKISKVLTGEKSDGPEVNFLHLYYPYVVSDLVTRIEWSNSSQYLNSANYLFDAALNNYLTSYTQYTPTVRIAVGQAALDLYRINHKDNYLELAKYIFNQEKNNSVSNLQSITQYQLLSNSLARALNDKSYLVAKTDLYNFVMKNYYHQMTYIGDESKNYAVLYGPGQKSITQEILPNAIFAGLIIQ